MIDNDDYWLGNTFTHYDNGVEWEVDSNYLKKAKLLMIVYTASWWDDCKLFKARLKEDYVTWNKQEKIIEVVIISGDKNIDDF
jgi:hypothetical protein